MSKKPENALNLLAGGLHKKNKILKKSVLVRLGKTIAIIRNRTSIMLDYKVRLQAAKMLIARDSAVKFLIFAIFNSLQKNSTLSFTCTNFISAPSD